jgi:hypothetical protein
MKSCIICGSSSHTKTRNGKVYCGRHYQQLRRHGKVLDRTIYDANEIVLYDDYAELICYTRDGQEKARALISLADVDKVKKYKWCYNAVTGMVTACQGRLYLSRYIMDCPAGMQVDHINGDRLDNRRQNLRICTAAQNSMNRLERVNNTSGFRGVSQRKDGQYEAYIHYQGRKIHLGLFATLTEAINARLRAEIKYYKEYSPVMRDALTQNLQKEQCL